MDHVDLTPYPFPPGMDIPRLMPLQEYPFNGDGYLAAEVLRLKEAHGLGVAVETGTCLGSTTIWLREHFRHTYTMDVSQAFMDIAHARFDLAGIPCLGGEMRTSNSMWGSLAKGPSGGNSIITDTRDSAKNLPRYADNWKSQERNGERLFFFLDAHWNDHCPLLDELDAIAAAKVKPCIIIHDFQVPGTDFGFDKMPDGRPFNLELIAGRLDRIYGEKGWACNYPTEVEGARRGWISVEPRVKP